MKRTTCLDCSNTNLISHTEANKYIASVKRFSKKFRYAGKMNMCKKHFLQWLNNYGE